MSVAVRSMSLTYEEFEHRLRAVEPALLLLPPRLLRRVIKLHRGLGGLGLHVPHRDSYLVERESLLKILTPSDLKRTTLPAGDPIVLLPLPEKKALTETDPGQLLLQYWRLLFHAQIHRELSARRLSEEEVLERIRQVGAVEIEEARAVLTQENRLLDGNDLVALYEEFVASFLELRYFDEHHLHFYFPATDDLEETERSFGRDVDAGQIYVRTRPEGAAEVSITPVEPETSQDLEAEVSETATPEETHNDAMEQAQKGNQVRAVILRLQASHKATIEEATRLLSEAQAEVERFTHRVCSELGCSPLDKPLLRESFWSLAQVASRGVWNPEMRFLYEMQKVCLDQERPLYTIDLVEAIVTGFRRPLCRALVDVPMVRTVKHLGQLQRRLAVIRVPDKQRQELSGFLNAARTVAEKRLRDTIRPKLRGALDQVGLTPANVAETMARDKLVEELLDGLGQRGYLTLPDLRDALARNRLKLPDLSSPEELVRGDPLLRLNHELTAKLDGIYRGGEIYLRWLQSLSSLFFGNRVGRGLTLFLILPLLGSLFILKGVDGIGEESHKYLGTPKVSELFRPASFVGLALFLLGVLHVPVFRRWVSQTAWWIWWGIRGLLYDLPVCLFRLPLVRAILQSRIYLVLFHYVAKPFVMTLPVVWLLWLLGVSSGWMMLLTGLSWLLFSVGLNTRLGWMVEDMVTDWVALTWRLVCQDLIPGMFRWVVWLSRQLQERVERLRYSVEEWLLFRQGQHRLLFWTKVVLSAPWFVISYLFRFIVIVLLEPQVNPIKHFPVVTVSHKLMLLLVDPIAHALAPRLGWTVLETSALVFTFLGLIPGVFGFLAWELKENWRLYRANQSPTIDPEMIGSHGEQMIHFIRPGFHSGTLPKLFVKLRHAQGKQERKKEEALHHVEEELRRFAERELIAPLGFSRNWPTEWSVQVGQVHLATNRIRIELICAGVAGGPCWLDFAQRQGELLVQLRGPGWMQALEPAPRELMVRVLTAFYKRAGVDRLTENLDDWTLSTSFSFAEYPLTWERWVQRWQEDQAGKRQLPGLLPEAPVLPALVGEFTHDR